MAQPTKARRKLLGRRKLAIAIVLLCVVSGIWHIATLPAKPERAQVTTKPAETATATTQASAKLQAIVSKWAAAQPVRVAVQVSQLGKTSVVASYKTEQSMVTASTYKLFVAYALLHSIEQGNISLSTVLNNGQTVQAALTQMIVHSDNASAEALGFKLGWAKVNAAAANIGATHTNINNYAADGSYTSANKLTTPHDLSTLLSQLQAGTLLSGSHTQLLVGLMKQQVWRERVPAGVPNSIAVADKPGWLTVAEGDGQNVQNDAAVVYGPKSTYILVVMTAGGTTQPLANLSQLIYYSLES